MTKKNIRPQQAAPVQRETVGANSSPTRKMTKRGVIALILPLTSNHVKTQIPPHLPLD